MTAERDEIPAYQPVDILFGLNSNATTPPVRGWVVTAPDRDLDAEMFTDEEAANRHVEAARLKSKWPDQVFARPCWVHSGKYWTLR